MMSDFIFQRMGENSYNEQLESQYKRHLQETGTSYFKGQIDEAFETDEKGNPLTINQDALEENEDELIRLMHDRFMEGKDSEYFDYGQVDNNEEYDDIKKKEQDEEDRWFDEEEPQSAVQEKDEGRKESVYTGVLDY